MAGKNPRKQAKFKAEKPIKDAKKKADHLKRIAELKSHNHVKKPSRKVRGLPPLKKIDVEGKPLLGMILMN